MTDTAASRRMGIIYMTVASIAWSTAGIFARFAPDDLATTVFWRSLFAFLGMVVVLFLFHRRDGLPSFRRLGRPGLMTAVAGGLAAFVTVPAMVYTSVAHVVVIYATAPFMAGGIAWIVYGQRPSRADVLASIVALIGAVIMIGLGHDGGWLGNVFALILTLSMSVVMVLFRQYPDVPSLPTAVIAFGLSTLACLFLLEDYSVPVAALPFLAAFGLVNSALGTAFFLLGSRLLRPVETAILGALETPLAPLWVWLVLGETPSQATLIGGGVVMAAVIWHTLRSAKPQQEPASPP